MPDARTTRLWAVGLLAAASAACGGLGLTGLDLGGTTVCHPYCGAPKSSLNRFILVFPAERLADGGRLQVGDTVTFLLVDHTGPTSMPRDTIADVVWSLSEPAVGSIESDSAGRGTFVAGSPGRTDVIANERHYPIWACRTRADGIWMCTSVGIEVEP